MSQERTRTSSHAHAPRGTTGYNGSTITVDSDVFSRARAAGDNGVKFQPEQQRNESEFARRSHQERAFPIRYMCVSPEALVVDYPSKRPDTFDFSTFDFSDTFDFSNKKSLRSRNWKPRSPIYGRMAKRVG
jgi:hypothetical protein